MISNFAHRGLKRFFEKGDSRHLPPELVNRIRTILARLSAAERLEEMDIHGYHLHQLTGDRKGVWSVTVRANWRITFRFKDGFALGVNLEDYH